MPLHFFRKPVQKIRSRCSSTVRYRCISSILAATFCLTHTLHGLAWGKDAFVYDPPSGTKVNEANSEVEELTPEPVQSIPQEVPSPFVPPPIEPVPLAPHTMIPNPSDKPTTYVSTDLISGLELKPVDQQVEPVEQIKTDPWWNEKVGHSLSKELQATPVDLETLIWMALSNSPNIQSILTTPQIRDAQVNEAHGVFDRTRFVDSIFKDTSDPVGNLLTTGGAPRLNERFLDSKAGVRGKNRYGGQTELAQELGLRDNNSQFFVPNQQADSRLVVRYTHPLRKGAGTFYNYSSIAIAQVAANVSRSESNREIQNHVFEICQSYWNVFYNRAILLQGQLAVERLSSIAENIATRADVDGTQSQAARARAAVASQQAKVQRAAADLAKAEAQLKSLIGVNEFVLASGELIPMELPLNMKITSDLNFELAVALEKRPELLALRDQIRGSRIQQQIAENELRPTLNLVTEAYVRGLNGDYAVADTFGDQFARGRPSYNAGLTYERPRNNTSARAIMRQRNLQMRQLLFDLDQQLLNVSADVASAAAELEATFAEYSASVDSTLATNEELNYLAERWKSNPYLENSNPALLLDELLDAESRLIQSENNWALAQSNYMIAIARAKLAAGSLLEFDPIVPANEETQTSAADDQVLDIETPSETSDGQ